MGNKGSRQEKISEKDLTLERGSEDIEALKVLGLSEDDNVNLNLGDGEINNSLETISSLVKEIRRFKPELIVTHNAEKKIIRDMEGSSYVNHRDHLNTGISVIDAVYPYSRDLLFFPDQIKDGLSAHICTEFLFVDSWGDPDTIFIDVTNQIEKRLNAIMCHKSQYSKEKALASNNYFAKENEGKRFEQFRYVVAD
jgi:LmbE family N-acetylglucosaminyl deacetylase